MASSAASPPPSPFDAEWNSRRSTVYARHGMVACTNPLACQIGLDILKAGGNCVDAAVAVAAALNVTEPFSTGIGGDMFLLHFDGKTKKVSGLNGSGRSPAALNLEVVTQDPRGISFVSPHAVTVPGAAAGWVDSVERFGSMSMKEVLAPAIKLAREGFPVQEVAAWLWDQGKQLLLDATNGGELLLNGAPPKAGEIMYNATLADTFEALANEGKDGFYKGRVAQEIVNTLTALGGVMTLEDLANHKSDFVEPIHVNYRGVDVYEIPPNGQGLAVLLALNILEQFPVSSWEPSSSVYAHHLIEALRLAFADTQWWATDPATHPAPLAHLLSRDYAAARAALIDSQRRSESLPRGDFPPSSDTVYFCVVDSSGSAASFINSNYRGFGTGFVPKGCGFTLQNRGNGFNLSPSHPNFIQPNKRPYHTIIPGMAVKNGELMCPFGVMGAYMQPQGHVQVLCNMIDFGMSPQAALDAPRLCLDGTVPLNNNEVQVYVEEGIDAEGLRSQYGHSIVVHKGRERTLFGRGQIILRDPETGVLCAGSDPRADGHAVGY